MTARILIAAALSLALLGCGGKPADVEAPRYPPAPPGFCFDYADDFSEGMAAVMADGHYGFIDATGRMVVAPEFVEVKAFCDGMARVAVAIDNSTWKWGSRDVKWGYVNRVGQVVAAPKLDRVTDFYDGFAIVSETGGPEPVFTPPDGDNGPQPAFYVIDHAGWRLHEQTFDYIDEFRRGYAVVELGGKSGFLRCDGSVIAPQYDEAWPFDNGLAAVKLNGEWGFIDESGKVAIPFAFDDLLVPMTIDFCSKAEERAFPAGQCFHEGRAAARVGEKWGYIDRAGRLLITPRYDYVGFFNQGLTPVVLNGKWGFIDRDGRVVVEPRFDGFTRAWGHRSEGFEVYFCEGLAGASLDGKVGFIDKTGRVVIPPRWFSVNAFDNGMADVFLDADFASRWPPVNVHMGLIDRTGKVLVEPRFSAVRRLGADRALVLVDAQYGDKTWRIGGKWGVVDFSGKFVVPPRYDDVRAADASSAWVCTGTRDKDGFLRNKHWSRIDRDGNVLEKGLDDYDDLEFSDAEDIAPCRDEKGNYGYIDRDGRWVIPPRFEDARPFVNGFAAVSVLATDAEGNGGPKYGFIDKTGKVLQIGGK